LYPDCFEKVAGERKRTGLTPGLAGKHSERALLQANEIIDLVNTLMVRDDPVPSAQAA